MRKLLVALVIVAFLAAPAAMAYDPPALFWEGDGIDIHHPDNDPIYRVGKEGPPPACPQYILRQVDVGGEWFGIEFSQWIVFKVKSFLGDDDQWEGERLE
jgi:hypothetical protein